MSISFADVISSGSPITVLAQPVGIQGPRGETGGAGIKGDQGVPGVAGAGNDLNYVHDQAVPSQLWTINHPLNKFPNLTVVDSAGSTVFGEVNYLSPSAITVAFSSVFSGKAFLN